MIEQAFDEAGVIFLQVGDTRSGGRGVRLKWSRRKPISRP
jgi:hypothetical protein